MAISLSRASRGTSHSVPPQTGEHVGPGTYANTHNEPRAPVGERPVPFNSLQDRVLNQNRTTSAITPGPGVYAAEVNRIGKKDYGADVAGDGSTSFKSRAARFAPTAPGSSIYRPSTILANPGPGNYPKAGLQDLGKKWGKELVRPVKPVLEVAEKGMPSIPPTKILQAQQAAMQESDVTSIVVRHTGDGGDTCGPGEYDARSALVRQSPRTTAFHKSKLPRSIFEPSANINNLLPPRDIPGPGSYDIPGFGAALAQQLVDSEAVNTYQFASGSARPHQAELPPEKVPPGPGQYEITAAIDVSVRSARERSAQRVGATHFGSMTERTSLLLRNHDQPYKDPYHARSVPGPAHYPSAKSCFGDDPRSKDAEKAVPSTRRLKLHGVHHPSIVMALSEAQGPLQAFNSTDDRACNRDMKQNTPAPWQYNKEVARGASMSADLRERAKVGRRGAFGTCADRFYGSPLESKNIFLDQAAEGGGATASDNMGSTARSGANAEPKSMFQSTSPRFASAPGPREEQVVKVGKFETPPVGAYNLDKEPDYRSPFRKPRSDHLSFGSGRTRFAGDKPSEDVFSGHMVGLSNPGPGEYSPPQPPSAAKRHGASFPKSGRGSARVGCTAEGVGPGSYGSIDTHMLKPSFNVTTSQADGRDVSSSSRRSSSVRAPRR